MLKKILKTVALVILILVGIYLLLPSPAEPPPLPESLKSTEPGDTVEIPGLFAYYTNLPRGEVMAFYQPYFSRSKMFELPLLTYRLNHPPEYAWVVIRDTIHSSYLEEFVHPFRESWYVNGYEPANDPFNKSGQKLANFKFDGKEYTGKITVLKKESNPIIRLVIFGAVVLCLWWLAGLTLKTYEDIRYHR